MSKTVSNESYVTLATNENYALGALTLGQSLRDVNTNRKLTCLITAEVAEPLREQLKAVFDLVEMVDVLNSNDAVNLGLLKRPELGVTFTKMHCWRLTQYTKCVFLDADCLVLKNVDELFDREEFSASTDVGWPDCFNSGVFVFKPSNETYEKLLNFALSIGSFDGGDQGLLNAYFSNWSTADSSRRLPFIYNMTTNVSYSYAPAFKQFRESVRIVHFIGALKPWYYGYNLDTQNVTGNVTTYESEHLNVWWNKFANHILPGLNSETKTRMKTQLITKEAPPLLHEKEQKPAPAPVPEHKPEPAPVGGIVTGSTQHQQQWEYGHIEYTGRDSFDNIKAHLDTKLEKK